MKKYIVLIVSLSIIQSLSAQKPEYISFREFLDFEKYNIMSEQELYELNKLYFHYYAFLENKIWFTNLERNCDVQKDSIEIHHGKYSLKVSPEKSDSIYSFSIRHSFCEYRFKGDSLVFEGLYKGNNISYSDSISLYIYQANNIFKEAKLQITDKWQNFILKIPNISPKWNTDIAVEYKGKAVLWFDNFSFSVDNKRLDEIYPETPAELDHEFDESFKFNLTDSISLETYRNLETLCRVWGFLKYYHPAVQSGMYDWNYELFRILPKIMNCADKTSMQRTLCCWIQDLDKAAIKNEITVNEDSILFRPDFNWINSQELGDNLCVQLKKILNKPRPFYNYSVTLYHLDYPIFIEPLYDKISWDDDGYRLLCLFRYWNIINYFHPYRPYFENNWQLLLSKYIRLFVKAKNISDFEKAITSLTAEIKDAHTETYSPTSYTGFNIGQYESYQIPFESKVYKDGLIITGYWFEETQKCGLELGDVIISINAKSIKDIRKEKDVYFSFSNENGMINTYPLLSVSQDSASITYIRKGEEKSILLKGLFGYYGGTNGGTPMEQEPLISKRIINDTIAYINPMLYTSIDLTQQLDSIKALPELIVDLREYPIDNAIDTVLANFLLPDEVIYAFSSYSDLSNPGVFRKRSELCNIGKKNAEYYKGNVSILVNENSISKSEIIGLICSCAPRHQVVGTMTRGVLGNVCYIPFIGGYGTRMTGIGVYYPDGECTYPNGVRLDYPVQIMPEDIYNKQDYILNKALELINTH